MLSIKDKKVISFLRKNARISLTTLSKKTAIPVSTLYERLKAGEKDYILKHTSLLDFNKMGYGCRANVLIKIGRDDRANVKSYLSKCEYVNTLLKINNGYDFMFEAIFENIKTMEEFLEMLDMKFKIKTKHVFYIIEEVVREKFMAEPMFASV